MTGVTEPMEKVVRWGASAPVPTAAEAVATGVSARAAVSAAAIQVVRMGDAFLSVQIGRQARSETGHQA